MRIWWRVQRGEKREKTTKRADALSDVSYRNFASNWSRVQISRNLASSLNSNSVSNLSLLRNLNHACARLHIQRIQRRNFNIPIKTRAHCIVDWLFSAEFIASQKVFSSHKTMFLFPIFNSVEKNNIFKTLSFKISILFK